MFSCKYARDLTLNGCNLSPSAEQAAPSKVFHCYCYAVGERFWLVFHSLRRMYAASRPVLHDKTIHHVCKMTTYNSLGCCKHCYPEIINPRHTHVQHMCSEGYSNCFVCVCVCVCVCLSVCLSVCTLRSGNSAHFKVRYIRMRSFSVFFYIQKLWHANANNEYLLILW